MGQSYVTSHPRTYRDGIAQTLLDPVHAERTSTGRTQRKHLARPTSSKQALRSHTNSPHVRLSRPLFGKMGTPCVLQATAGLSAVDLMRIERDGGRESKCSRNFALAGGGGLQTLAGQPHYADVRSSLCWLFVVLLRHPSLVADPACE